MRSQSLWAFAFLASTTRATVAMTYATSASTEDVTLASFSPQINENKLSTSCAKVYNTAIAGCTPSDFDATKQAVCTAACLRGLSAITDEVKSGCAGVDVGELSIIGVFQNGVGTKILCPKAADVTSSRSSVASETTAVVRPSTTAAATTKKESSTTAQVTSSAAASSTTETDDGEESSTAQETSSSSSTGGLPLDPNATGTLTTTTVVALPTDTASSSTNGAAATPAPNAQLSNADSGGGSPFDVQATGSSPQLRAFDIAAGATLLATTLMFIVCA
jgi:uncharacterized cupin superfamily protein